MNFETAIDTINKDFCNLFYAKYLKGLWSMVVGYRTVPEYIIRMRKQLADWQIANDCSNQLCTQSKLQVEGTSPVITILSYGTLAPSGACVLNPPLESFSHRCFDRHWWIGNINDILISSFTR